MTAFITSQFFKSGNIYDRKSLVLQNCTEKHHRLVRDIMSDNFKIMWSTILESISHLQQEMLNMFVISY